MDVDTQAVHQENGVNNVEDAGKKNSDIETNGHAKETVKNVSKPKKRRSRSRTPQSKTEDLKLLHVSLKQMENNSNDIKIPEEDAEAVKRSQKTDEESKTEETKAEEGTPSRRSKRQKDKEDTPKIDEEVKEKTPKKDSMPKKEETDKSEQPAKKDDTPKVEQSVKKDSPSKNEHASKKDNISKIEQSAKIDSTPKNEHATVKETTPKKTNKDKKENNEVDNEPVEMDPLFISDEPDPELLFDENSDMESGKGSPIIPRCITRRSLTRNIPTPKTPKSLDTDLDSEKTSTSTEHLEPNLDDTSDITDITNASIKVEVGSDLTRLEYTDRNCTITDDNSYLEVSRERSLSETLRSLSARRPIRPSEDIRRRVLKNAQVRSDLNLPYSSYDSVEQVHSGVKRKGRSATPEETKKFKADSPGFNNLFFSPLASLRSKFGRTDLPSSTPKLLGYRDHRNDTHFNENYENINGDDEKKSWCSVM